MKIKLEENNFSEYTTNYFRVLDMHGKILYIVMNAP